MKGIGRNIRFFGWLNGKLLLMMGAFVLIFPALFSLMEEGSFTEKYFSMLGFYMIIMGPLMLFMQAVSGFMQYLPMAIAMSSSRKSALTGMLAAYYSLGAILTAAAFFVYAVVPMNTDYFQYKYQIMGVMLFVTCATNLMGAVLLKLGPKAGFAVYFICYVAVMGAMIFIVFGIKNNSGSGIFAFLNSWKILPITAVLSGASLIAPYLAVRKLEAKA